MLRNLPEGIACTVEEGPDGEEAEKNAVSVTEAQFVRERRVIFGQLTIML